MLYTSHLVFFASVWLHAFGSAPLEGKTLKGCILIEKPYVAPDMTHRRGFSGVAIKYLFALEEELGFKTVFEKWDLTWNEFIERMSKCDPSLAASSSQRCPCDIGIGGFVMTNERHNKIQFIAPFSNEAYRMVSRRSDLRVDDSKNMWFFFHTFKLSEWIIIAICIFLHAVGTMLFVPFRGPRHQMPVSTEANVSQDATESFRKQFWHRLGTLKRFPAAFLFAFAHILGHPLRQGTQGTPSFHRSAWLVLGVTFGLSLMIVYGACLTVLLFESTRTSQFKTLDEVKNCSIDPGRIAINGGGASQKFWETAVVNPNRAKCNWTRESKIVEDIVAGFDYLEKEKVDFYLSVQGGVLTRVNGNCDKFFSSRRTVLLNFASVCYAKESNWLRGCLQQHFRENTNLKRARSVSVGFSIGIT